MSCSHLAAAPMGLHRLRDYPVRRPRHFVHFRALPPQDL